MAAASPATAASWSKDEVPVGDTSVVCFQYKLDGTLCEVIAFPPLFAPITFAVNCSCVNRLHVQLGIHLLQQMPPETVRHGFNDFRCGVGVSRSSSNECQPSRTA